jgi:hypothetical protein
MTHFLIWQRLADYAVWRAAFDGHADAQKAAGLTVVHVWRCKDDPNRVYVLFAITDVPRTEAFLGSPELGNVMRAAGVLEAGGEFLTLA